MSDAQMTPWFPIKVKPVHNGVYEVRLDTAPRLHGFSFWNGDRWGAMSSTTQMASTQRYVFADWASQNKKWRGFTERQS